MTFTENFMELIGSQQNDIVKFILEDGSLHNAVIQPEKTIWYGEVLSKISHYAAASENNELVNYLLTKGCHVDVADSAGNTPLMWVVSEAEELGGPTAKILLEAGADVYLKNNQGQDAIAVAIKRDYPMTTTGSSVLATLMEELRKKYPSSGELAEILIKNYKCRIDQAVCSKDPTLIRYMLERGISDTRQALHVAVTLNEPTIVQLLFQYGADAKEWDDFGERPLWYLSKPDYPDGRYPDVRYRETLEILNIFLSKSNVTSSEVMEDTAYGLRAGSPEIIRALLASRIDFTATSKFGETLLHYLASNTNPGVIEELKHHVQKVDRIVDAFDVSGYTPLHRALDNSNVEMVKFLLYRGAKVDGCLFHTFLHFDANLKSRDDQCAEVLLQYNADPQQCIVSNGRVLTIFNDAFTHQIFSDRINLALARLAILEKQGVTIKKFIRSKIDSHCPFKEYFGKCRRVLDTTVDGNVTVFKLLTVGMKKMVGYLNNKDVASCLTTATIMQNIRQLYRYYYITLEKRFREANIHRNLRNNAARVLSEISEGRLDSTSVTTEKVIDYLSDDELQMFS